MKLTSPSGTRIQLLEIKDDTMKAKPQDDDPIEIIVAEPMMLRLCGKENTRHVDIGEKVSIPRKDARTITRSERAFYIRRDEDHSSQKYLSATPERLQAIEGRVAEQLEKQKKAERARQREIAADK
jgi:hypothetical protein